jgi:hypothetical protein
MQRHADASEFVAALKQALSGSRVQGNKIEGLGEWIIAATDPKTAWNSSLADLEILAEIDPEREGQDRRPETATLTAAGFNVGESERIARSLKPEAWLALSLTPIKSVPNFDYRAREGDYISFRNASAGQQATALLGRKGHALAMIALSDTTGKILAVRNPVVVALRDAFTYVAGLIPPVKRYFVEMRFKPMPRYKQGALDYGPRGYSAGSQVGKMFIQPSVSTDGTHIVRLDDLIGQDFALLAWGTNPHYWLTDTSREKLRHLSTRILVAVPKTQRAYEAERLQGVTVIGDTQGRLKQWFSNQPDGIVILRPDRFVAATCLPLDLNDCIARVAVALHLLPIAEPVVAGLAA